MAGDKAQGAAVESASVEVVSEHAPGTNLDPAWEEGPHLNDPEIRALKRKQLKDAGVGLSHPHMTEDMKAILRDKS